MSQNILNTSKVSELFFRWSRAAISAVHGWIWSNFELIQDLQFSLLPAKKKKIQLKNESARVFTSLYNDFSDAQGQVTL